MTVYLKPGTQRRYRDHLARHLLPALGDRRLDAITAADVTRLHGSMRETPAQANNALSVLSTLFSCAARWGALPADHAAPTQYVRKYKLRARARFLTPEERARLERALAEGERVASGRAGALRWSTVGAIRLLALTGMRRGEVLGLRWSMVDRRRRCLRLPDSKTGQKVVPISGHALALLDELARRRAPGCDYVLYSSQRRPLHTSTLEDSWRIVRARAGLEGVRLHDLRHSAASDAINAGVSLEVIREILGHADIRTTQRYAHLTRGVIAEGVERMGASIVAASGEGDSPA
ncbi:MAG: site-specific integrase [Myxococcales bacterium]|nr:site-specific integrase [Myxococcales bacterium]